MIVAPTNYAVISSWSAMLNVRISLAAAVGLAPCGTKYRPAPSWSPTPKFQVAGEISFDRSQIHLIDQSSRCN
ncbi:hypothetical protein BDW67DRAFT_100451 [Aspergillus spinulosporus]